MRLHHLTVTAFGPFAGTVEVDFDELSEAGLFLLTGATGAGKTSILDAVCFALYGQVPGDRSGAKHLRSDHAPVQLAPEIALRVSIGDREFRFTRSPAWSRPKLRGQGETRVQAHVLVEEVRGGEWRALTNRLDEAGQLVTDLLGMTGSQFTQVAMLPQGRFQAFLRATSAERHAVLQQLFRTDRFERVERWLVDRRTEARRASEAAAAGVLEDLNRLREVATLHDPPPWSEDLPGAADRGEIDDWLTEISGEAALGEAATGEASAAAEDLLTGADAALHAAQDLERLQTRGTAATRTLTALESRSGELEAIRERLASHRKAEPVAPLAARATEARQEAERAQIVWDRHRAAVPGLLPAEVDRPALATLQRLAHDAVAVAVAFAPRAAARTAAQERLVTLRGQLQTLETGIAELDLRINDQPAVINDAVAAVHEARAAAARLPVLSARAEQLTGLVTAARRAQIVGLELAASRTDVLEATETAQAAKERHLDIREARISGMAGELAGQLASGCSCPVCGSASHPAPASANAAGVSRADEDRARKEQEDAAFTLQARKVGLATLESELAGLDSRLEGQDRDALPTELLAVQDEVERLEPLVSALDVLVDREQVCRTQLHQAESSRGAALLERAALRVEADQLAALLASIDDEWEQLLGVPGAAAAEQPGDSLAELVRLRHDQAAALDVAATALEAWVVAARHARSAADDVLRAAQDAGFTSAAEAAEALLPADEVARGTDQLTDADLAARGATATLAEPPVAAALLLPPAGVVDLTARRREAHDQARSAASAYDAAVARRQRVDELCAGVRTLLAAWDPLRDQHRTTAALAALAEGKSVDNPLRMRLAAYVLAERLKQVVAAANERLAGMTDQRYALEHTDDRGYGEQRGGLSLLIRDDWNGIHRDPATLSGGETFVVSLALALGLADTVAHEAGGVDIDTLFIDEGFGSLDADTLEDVMDTLDSLRDGGRVVGLVSHVPELRSRITTQLEVSKGRTGSTVRAAVAAG